jgi:hypothetical protein
VSSEGSFLVEDFINAITTQLDRVQDSLRLKAINRPLTYALKDISLDLNVFVEVDPQGNIKFRSSRPNEEGASTIKLGFTTITKPMIEENTVSLAMSSSPHLEELGLGNDERKQLENLGVRNAAQLQKLGKQTGGSTTISRLTGIPIDRLKKALSLGKPNVTHVSPSNPVRNPPPVIVPPKQHNPPPIVRPKPPIVKEIVPQPIVVRPIKTAPPIPKIEQPIIKIPLGTKRLNLFGSNLIGGDGTPKVKLNNKLLNIADADEDVLVVEMPENNESGALEVELADGQQILYQLSFDDEETEDFQDDSQSYSFEEDREQSFSNDHWLPE